MSEGTQSVAAVLFDMDGVLIDSKAVIERAWREAAHLYGREITEEQLHKHIHGQPGPHTIAALFHDLPQSDQARVQAHVIHVENTAPHTPIPGVARLIAQLSATGITLGIVTSGWRAKIDRVIEAIQAEGFFSVIVERDDVARGKPHPDPYLLAAERLALPPAQTLVFEDSTSGVTAAVSAGAYCVGIGGEELTLKGARIAIPDFEGVELEAVSPDRSVLTCRPGHALFIEHALVQR